MKFKVKALVAASAMVMASGANAAIESGTPHQAFGAAGNGEMFFSVVERDVNGNALQSYNRDLGLTAFDWKTDNNAALSNAGAVGGVFTADNNMSNFINNISAGSTVRWNLAGNANGWAGNDLTPDQYGFFATAAQDLVAAVGSAYSFSAFSGTNDNIQTYTQQVDNYAAANFGDSGLSSDNTSILTTDGTAGYSHDGINWGNNWFGTGLGGSEVDLGSTAGFYLIVEDNAGNFDGSSQGFTEGFWTLENDGDLVYSSGVSQIPLPPAVWLLGSALIGLAGITRRRQAAKAA